MTTEQQQAVKSILASAHNLAGIIHTKNWDGLPEAVQDLELSAKILSEQTGHVFHVHKNSSLRVLGDNKSESGD